MQQHRIACYDPFVPIVNMRAETFPATRGPAPATVSAARTGPAFWPVTMQWILLLLFLPACCLHESARRIFQEYSAPATLERELLLLHATSSGVRVWVRFHFRAHEPGLRQCYFPAGGYTLEFPGQAMALRQPQLLGFTVQCGTNRLDWWRKDNQIHFLVPLATRTTVTISYRCPWRRRGREQLFGYVLRSGRAWRGPIGRLEIRVTAAPGVSLMVAPPYRMRQVLQTIEPEADLLIRCRNKE